MKLISKVAEIYCIADDVCKEYELELNKKALSLSNRNFKHFYLFYVCRELKEEFTNLLSYTRFVERMPRVAVPLLLFLKLALMRNVQGLLFRFDAYSRV